MKKDTKKMVEEVECDTRRIRSVIKKNMLTPCIGVILQNLNYRPHYSYSSYSLLDVHGSVHHNNTFYRNNQQEATV